MALIRCKKCGNPASSKSKACPVCGEPISSQAVVADVTPAVPVPPKATEEVATQAVNTPTADVHKADSGVANNPAPQTLNDLIAQRAARRTLNDSMSSETDGAETKVAVSEVVSSTSEAEQMPEIPTSVAPSSNSTIEGESYNYDATIDDYEQEIMRYKRSSKGYMIIALVLVVLLIPAGFLSVKWGLKAKTIEEDYALIQSARQLFEDQNTALRHDAESLVLALDSLKGQNDTMLVKYQEAVIMLEQLQREKTYNYDQLARYRREVETLRSVMRGYLAQIDSLNNVNSTLQAQNIAFRSEISNAQLRADVAEERADELDTRVRIGAVIRSSGIRMVALNNNSREVRSIRRAARLRVDFELTANDLAEPGEKSVYVCITGPDGYPLTPSEMIIFSFEGEDMMASAMRKVDYENQSVPVSIYYDGGGFERGTYKVDIYLDGRLSGTQEVYFE